MTQHKIIFSAILTLVSNSKNADIITVSEALTDAQLNSCGGIAYIAELTKIPSTLNFKHYFSILRNYTKARKINTIINYSIKELPNLVFSDVNSSDQLIAKIETDLFKLYNKFHEKNRLSISELIDNFIVFLEEEKSPFISTGFTDLDNKIGGLESEGITLVGARPAMGKTAWLMSLISYYIQEKTNQQNQKIKPIFIFSLEMDAQSLMMRIISILSKVSFIDIKNKYLDENDYGKITNAVNLLIRFKCANNQNALIIDDDAHLTPAILRRKLQRYIRLYSSPEFVAIDYIQLMTLGTNHSENRAVELSTISRELKIQAKDFSIPLLLLAQLNRFPDSRPDKRPIMSDFKESGAIEQDATNVILLY